MFRSAALFLTVVVSFIFKVNAEAIATPPSPTHHSLAASEELRRRQSGLNGTDYCWGEGAGSGICAFADTLLLLCSGFIDDSDKTLYPKCLCGNGHISSQQACDWCLLDFNLPVGGGIYTVDTSSCASASATIAPIPSSILSSMSAWNVSFSGFLATAFSSGANGSNSASTGQAIQSTTGSVSSAWTSTYTLVGGALPTSTTSEGPEATSSTPTSGSNASGAKSQRTMSCVAVVAWILLFGVSFLYVILI